ncbi:hypothetical protein [Luteimonas sp. 100069]|uniref:hypothetical protein n=1 Tax=Luteimonas sp. 100069 TaxID=2006109 RepID=UPI000F508AE5|nr:hypothetical protein [Luteimonas sp. 100069]RPD87745.1 hypothetical protein EGK76_00635 [Luteimonas sp. 100069]
MTTGISSRVLLAALAFCGTTAASADDATRVTRDADAIVYVGELSAAANSEVQAILDAEPGVQWLHITSGGGEVNLGIDLGELVRARGLNIKVVDYCASSCANYVFPAGRRKLLPADTAVVWHGSTLQAGVGDPDRMDLAEAEAQLGRAFTGEEKAQLAAQMRSYFEGITRRQDALYRALDIDQRITVFGQDIGCDCEWTISAADMARFGVTGVEAADGYGGHLAPKGKPIRLLRLDDHPAYAAALDARVGAAPTPAPSPLPGTTP